MRTRYSLTTAGLAQLAACVQIAGETTAIAPAHMTEWDHLVARARAAAQQAA